VWKLVEYTYFIWSVKVVTMKATISATGLPTTSPIVEILDFESA